ncbi:MAG TPA: hypothetical protein VJU86_09585 [Pyrinomonadaceae bacterium]|nr:hypothetical protein [Pyrinomonadaceae bacterium]
MSRKRSFIVIIFFFVAFASSVQAQYKIDSQLCEEIKVEKTQISIQHRAFPAEGTQLLGVRRLVGALVGCD